MSRRRAVNSKEVGLLAGLYVFRYFAGARDIHYGYWTDELELDVRNIALAQQAYSDFLLSHIPAGTRRILDVGMGAGNLALKLRQRGYEVEGVSPSALLSAEARAQLGAEFTIHAGRYEDVAIPGRFDLVLFSESYQYIDLPTTFAKSLALLEPGGHILICDFFKRDTPDQGVIGGGHRLSRFLDELGRHPLEVVADEDITAQTAPNLDLTRDMGDQLLRPLGQLATYTLERNYPRSWRLLRWVFRRRLQKLERKYASGERCAASFAHYKTYRLVLLRRPD